MKQTSIRQTQRAVTYQDGAELRTLLRLSFYAGLKRRPPQQLISMPSYVRAVERHFALKSRNAARAMLAVVEGFDNWSALVAAMMREASPK